MSEKIAPPPEASQSVEQRDISPTATRIRNAAESIGSFLEERAKSNAHDEALKEYRDRDHSGYVDHIASLAEATDKHGEPLESQNFGAKLLSKEHSRADREKFIEDGKQRLSKMGSTALDLAKNAGLITVGVGVMGYNATAKLARESKLKHDIKSENKDFIKSYKKETGRFDKQAKRESKKLDKANAIAIKKAKRDDKRFDRSMNRKATIEKWQDRAIKVGEFYANSKEATIVRAENGARRVGNTYRSSKETYEAVKTSTTEKKRKLGAFALKARVAGQAAIVAGREEFNKK